MTPTIRPTEGRACAGLENALFVAIIRSVSSIALNRLTIVVPNYGAPAMTIRCVRALLDDGVGAERVVVVDNGSEDDSRARLEAELPDCSIVALPENVGYSRAANAGAAHLEGDAYLVMNNDAFVHQAGSVQLLLEPLADSSVGLVVPRLLNADLSFQPSVRPLQTPRVTALQATGLGRFVPNRWQPRWSHHWDHRSSREIESANGAVVLARKEAWDQLGGYNPARQMYGEDSDLFWRARKLGWRVWFTTKSEFVHLGNATGSRVWADSQRAALIGREEAKLLRDELSSPAAWFSVGAVCLYLTWRRLAFLAAGDPRAAEATKAARSAYLAGLRASTGAR
jgi:N-acetylglucosaminyl-diphospho-decaprenol L-rhamnosyltransferase